MEPFELPDMLKKIEEQLQTNDDPSNIHFAFLQEEMKKFYRGLRLFEQRIHFTSRGGAPNV